MEKTEFIKAVVEYAEQFGEVELRDIEKPSGIYQGLHFKKPSGVPSPVINLDMLYDDFGDSEDLDPCFDVVERIANQTLPGFDPEVISEWEKAKYRLELIPFNTNPGGFYREFDGVFYAPYVSVIEDGGVRVTDQLLSLWGDIDINEVFIIAGINATRLLKEYEE